MSVRRSTGPGGHRLLRAHVARRPEHIAGQRQPGVPRDAGQPEVGHPQAPAAVQEQVGRLDVAVQDALLMRVLQRPSAACIPR